MKKELIKLEEFIQNKEYQGSYEVEIPSNFRMVRNVEVCITNLNGKNIFRNEVYLSSIELGCEIYLNPTLTYIGDVYYVKKSMISKCGTYIELTVYKDIELENLYKDYLDKQFGETIYLQDEIRYSIVETIDYENVKDKGYQCIGEIDFDILSFEKFLENKLKEIIKSK